MRQFSDLPRDDGSRRFQRCPPSHHEMALPPHLAQASARAPRPSRPTPSSTVLSAQVSPYQQRGSTMPSAVSPTPLAQAAPPCRSDGWMAPSPISFGASTPSYSPCCAMSSASMGGGLFPDGSMLFAVGGGDSIQSPDGHRRMGCSCTCGRCLRGCTRYPRVLGCQRDSP